MLNTDILKLLLHWIYNLMDDGLQTFVNVVGEAFDDIVSMFDTIKTQIDPFEATVEGSLTDFERFYKCIPASGDSVSVRRNRVIAAIRSRGGMNISFFHAIAEALGYTIGTSGDKHLSISEGDYAPFRADYGRADIDAVYDQDSVSMYTVVVTGISVESDSVLQYRFDKQRCCGVSFEYVNS